MEVQPGLHSIGEATEDWPLIPSLLLEAAPSGWLIVDLEGLIVMVNRHVEELFGYSRAELIGSIVDMLLPDALHEQHAAHRRSFARNMTSRRMGQGMMLHGRRKDGSIFPLEVGLSPVHTPAGAYVIAVIQDVSDRIALEGERNQFALELEMERERQRIGMDLHDGVMQEIYAAGLTLELALEDLAVDSNHNAAQDIERAITLLHGVIRNIRSYIFDLRPREFSGSLRSALEELGREFGQNSLIETETNVDAGLPEIPNDKASAVYHITHEALSNVHKHAKAAKVGIRLGLSDGALQLEIQDDGSGFDTGRDVPQQHRGMRNMSSRARAAGGFMEVRSVPGEGTTIRVEIPLTS